MQIGLEDRLVLLALIGVLLAHPHDRAQRLDVETVRLGLGIDIANVVGDGLLLFFEPFDAFDEGLQVILRKTGGGLFLDSGGSSHLSPPPVTQRVACTGFGSGGRQVKAIGQSSPEYTGERNLRQPLRCHSGARAQRGARNPYPRTVVMDSGLAPSARPGMTADRSIA